MRHISFSVARRSPKAKILFGTLLLTCALGTLCHAAATVWNDTDGDFSWDNADNWSNGIPATTATAVFDTAGGGTISNSATVGTDNAALLQFGLATETASPAAAAFTLASGTISLPDAASATIISYLGSANTATQTISSNLVLGTTALTGVTAYTITDSSAGSLVINGAVTLANTATTTNAGTTTFNDSLTLNILPSAGANVTLSGAVNYQGTGAASGAGSSFLNLGSSASTAYGNLTITNIAALTVPGGSPARMQIYGTSGTLKLDTASGTAGTYNSFAFFDSSRSSASAPQLENVSGNNTYGNVQVNVGSAANFYLQSDSGLLTIPQIQQSIGGGAGVVTLDGVGNGQLNSVNDKVGTSLSVVKDGTGTWTLGTKGTSFGINDTNSNGLPTLTIAGGTLLLDGTESSTAAGAVSASNGALTVSNTGTSANGSVATLGGVGTIAGPVTVTGGGKINPGDVGSGATNIGTLTLASGLTVGSSTSSGVLQFDLDSTASTADKIALTGALTLTSVSLSLDDVGSATLASGTKFILLTYTGTLTGSFSNAADDTDVTVGSNTYLLDYGTGSDSFISLTVAGVPEPATWVGAVVLAGFAGVQILLRRRRVRAETLPILA